MDNNPEIAPMYSIYDKKGEAWQTPFFAKNDIFAQRVFILRIKEEGGFMNAWPEDFVLYRIGSFGFIDGKFTNGFQMIVEGGQIEKEKKVQNN